MPSRPRNIWVDDELWSQTKTYAQTHNLSAARVVHTALIRYLQPSKDAKIAVAPDYRPPAQTTQYRGDSTSQLAPDDD